MSYCRWHSYDHGHNCLVRRILLSLCRLLTRAHLRAAKNESAVSWIELEEFGEGLVCLTGDEAGPVRRALAREDRAAAAAVRWCG